MVQTKENFSARLNGVDAKHSKLLRRGYTSRVDKNGVIIAKPKPMRLRLPVKGAFLVVVCFIGLKAFMLLANGPDTYNDRLASLKSGTLLEQWGAAALAIDPATQFVVDQVAYYVR